jgi:hypothetical protein
MTLAFLIIFDMTDYCQQAVDLYVEAVGGKVILRDIGIPYVSESMLIQQASKSRVKFQLNPFLF